MPRKLGRFTQITRGIIAFVPTIAIIATITIIVQLLFSCQQVLLSADQAATLTVSVHTRSRRDRQARDIQTYKQKRTFFLYVLFGTVAVQRGRGVGVGARSKGGKIESAGLWGGGVRGGGEEVRGGVVAGGG